MGRKPRHDLPSVKIASFRGTRAERKRAVYVLVLVQTESRAIARRKSGLDRSSEARLIRKLREFGDIRDAPRPGRPVKYTEEVMGQVVQYLIAHSHEQLNAKELMGRMLAEGILQPPMSRGPFMQHMRHHLKIKGLRLQVNCSRTDFYLSELDYKKRLTFARQLLASRSDLPWDMAIFTDETTHEEHPHPKGKAACSPASWKEADVHLLVAHLLNKGINHASHP